jgi:transposase
VDTSFWLKAGGRRSIVGRPSKYPDEFRAEAVQMALATDTSYASVARRLGVNETTLRNWVNAHLADEARAADPLSVSPSEFEELRRLRKENKELKLEKEILREAAAYFAKETIQAAASGSSPTTDTSMASSGSAGSSRSPGRPSMRGKPARPRRGR